MQFYSDNVIVKKEKVQFALTCEELKSITSDQNGKKVKSNNFSVVIMLLLFKEILAGQKHFIL